VTESAAFMCMASRG